MIFRLPERYLKLPVGSLAVTLLALTGAGSLPAQPTPLQPKIAARPLTGDEVTAYKLPAGTQLSAGLTTVGIGQPVYLEAQVNLAFAASDIVNVTWELTRQPATSKVLLEDSPLGTGVPLYEPSDRLVAKVAGRTLLRPDVTGLYTVTARIATTTAGTVSLGSTIIAGTYVGSSACARCHSGGLAANKVPSWAKTGHASIFKQGMDGIASDHYGQSCLSCHTVGYDANPKAVNGGFDDVAKSLGWTFPGVLKAGNFDALPEALKNVGNIQCENCHGPGSQHAASGGNAIEISVANNSGVCGQCHAGGTHHVKTAEWNNSRHAIVTTHASGPGEESCVGCHTGLGFANKVNGAKVDTTYTPVNCQSCHEAHGQTTPGTSAHLVRSSAPVTLMDGTKVTSAGLGTLCMNCHQSRQNAEKYVVTTPGSARFGPHHAPQADMLMGTNAYTYNQKLPSSAHGDVVEDTCVTCHMQAVAATDSNLTKVGGHTFTLSLDDGKNPKVELVAACQKCHGPDVTTFDFPLFDYDGDGVIDGVQTEVQHLLDKLAMLLPPAGKAKSSLSIDATWSGPQLKAAYNWLFITEDRSRGIHNTAYTVGLLKASIADLGGK